MRTFVDFVDLIVSKNSTIETNEGEYTVKDIVDFAIKNKSNEFKISRKSSSIEFLKDFISAGLGGGTLLRDSSFCTKMMQDGNFVDDYFMSNTLTENPPGLFCSFTNGKSGIPRLISYDIEEIWSASEELSNISNRNSNSLYFNGVINPSIHFLTLVAIPSMITGGKIIDIRKFPNQGEPFTENPIFSVGSSLAKYKPTHSLLIPHIVPLLERTRSWRDVDLSSIESFMFAGEIIPPGLFKRIKDKGGIPFNVYSTSELLTPLSYNVDEKDIKILPNIEYKIIDNELFCKKKNAEWYSTGDAVEQKDDAIYILGLKKSEILHNGSKIYPEIYESIVRSNPKIVDVLLRKKTDKLILYYYGNVSEDTVQEMLKERFTDSNMPEIIKKLDYVIPRTLYGQPIRSNEFIFGFES
jgi:hypothetical protein